MFIILHVIYLNSTINSQIANLLLNLNKKKDIIILSTN